MRAQPFYRRSKTVLVFWRQHDAIACDYALGVERTLSGEALAILAAASNWSPVAALRRAAPALTVAAVRALVGTLARWRLLEASDEPVDARRERMRTWATWMPEAAFFHFATKARVVASLKETAERRREQLETEDYPDVVKSDDRAARIALPPFPRAGGVPALVLARRSWRRFDARPVTTPQLAALLGLTWGVQRWMRIHPKIRSALKTSPSPGATHSLEVYVVARAVKGLPRGIYHYRPDAHDLEVVRTGLGPRAIPAYLGGQPWFAGASALFLMTSVVSRVRWRYRFPRAYRTILLEAGHFGQTFCLLATWLGLAPFCSGLFDDALVERALRVDGVEETIVYAAGVGTRPRGTAWAGWPSADDAPPIELPTHGLAGRPPHRPARRRQSAR